MSFRNTGNIKTFSDIREAEGINHQQNCTVRNAKVEGKLYQIELWIYTKE